MTYLELKTHFTALLNRRDITTTLKETFLQQGLARIQRELRVPAMEKAVVATIGASYDGLLIPSDFIELINIIPTTSNDRLEKVDITKALNFAEYVGEPVVYARQGGRWILGPAPGEDATIRIDYYSELDGLSADADENIVSQIAPDMILYAALAAAGIYYVDKRQPKWEGEYKRILKEVQDQADTDETTSGAGVQPAYSWPED